MAAMTMPLGVDVLTAARKRIDSILDLYDTVAVCFSGGKDSHVAFKMSDMVRRLVDVHGVSFEEIEKKIGAYKGEVELLYKQDVWQRKDIQQHKYSGAWAPRTAEGA